MHDINKQKGENDKHVFHRKLIPWKMLSHINTRESQSLIKTAPWEDVVYSECEGK